MISGFEDKNYRDGFDEGYEKGKLDAEIKMIKSDSFLICKYYKQRCDECDFYYLQNSAESVSCVSEYAKQKIKELEGLQ